MFSHEEYDALKARAGFLDRSARGRLELTGADRLGYLHGLLTNDIARLSSGTGCYAALLTPQGRMISDVRVSELGDMVLLDLPASTAEAVRQRLSDFIFTEDVDVRDATSTLAQIGVYGARAPDLLARILAPPAAASGDAGVVPREQLAGMKLDENARWELRGTSLVVVASEDVGIPGFELFVDAAAAAALRAGLQSVGVLEVSPETAEVTRVEAGRPEFGTDMDEHTIPLEARIEGRAISLTKGCYVGQEIIIRVLHRGQGRVAKLLVGFAGDPEQGGFLRGDRIQRDSRDVGVVTSAVFSPALGRPIGLGYVHRDHAEPGTVLRVTTGGGEDDARSATIVSMPFTGPAGG